MPRACNRFCSRHMESGRCIKSFALATVTVFSLGTLSLAHSSCLPDQFFRGRCRNCPPGKWRPQHEPVCVIGCKRGTGFSGSAGDMLLCAACADGHRAPGGRSPCTLCPAGRAAQAGDADCRGCPAGQFSTAGAARCTLCVLRGCQSSHNRHWKRRRPTLPVLSQAPHPAGCHVHHFKGAWSACTRFCGGGQRFRWRLIERRCTRTHSGFDGISVQHHHRRWKQAQKCNTWICDCKDYSHMRSHPWLCGKKPTVVVPPLRHAALTELYL